MNWNGKSRGKTPSVKLLADLNASCAKVGAGGSGPRYAGGWARATDSSWNPRQGARRMEGYGVGGLTGAFSAWHRGQRFPCRRTGEPARTSCGCANASIARSGRAERSSKMNKWVDGLLGRQKMQRGHGRLGSPTTHLRKKLFRGWAGAGQAASCRQWVDQWSRTWSRKEQLLRPSAMPLRGSTTRPLRYAAGSGGPQPNAPP